MRRFRVYSISSRCRRTPNESFHAGRFPTGGGARDEVRASWGVDAKDRRAHWESVYTEKSDAQLSWWRAGAGISRGLIETHRPLTGASRRAFRVVDVGGGESTLGIELAREGYDVTVLDVSDAALARGRARAHAVSPRAAAAMRWLPADLMEVESRDVGTMDIWHDRAVFHFLTEPAHRQRYAALLDAVLAPEGIAVIGTFAPNGPEKCSGLPVMRYDAPAINAAMGRGFTLLDRHGEVHQTPWGSAQPFAVAVLQRAR